jgi:hypothetical protein
MNKGINEIHFNGNQIKFIANGYEIEDFSITGRLVISYDDNEYDDYDGDKEAISGKILRGYFCKSLGNKWRVEVRKAKWPFIGNFTKTFDTREEAKQYIDDFEKE